MRVRASAAELLARKRADLRRAKKDQDVATQTLQAISDKLHKANATFKTAKKNIEKAIRTHSKRISEARESNTHLEEHIPTLEKLKESTKAEYLLKSMELDELMEELDLLKATCTSEDGSPELSACEEKAAKMTKVVKSLQFRLEDVSRELLSSEALRIKNHKTLSRSTKTLAANKETLEEATLRQQQFVMVTLERMEAAQRELDEKVNALQDFQLECDEAQYRLEEAAQSFEEVRFIHRRHQRFIDHAISQIKHCNKMLTKKPSKKERRQELAQQELKLERAIGGANSRGRNQDTTSVNRAQKLQSTTTQDDDAELHSRDPGRVVHAGHSTETPSEGTNKGDVETPDSDDESEASSSVLSSMSALASGLDKREQLELVYEQSKGVAFGRERQWYRETGTSSLLAGLDSGDEEDDSDATSESEDEESRESGDDDPRSDAQEEQPDLTTGLGYVGGNFLVGSTPLLDHGDMSSSDSEDSVHDFSALKSISTKSSPIQSGDSTVAENVAKFVYGSDNVGDEDEKSASNGERESAPTESSVLPAKTRQVAEDVDVDLSNSEEEEVIEEIEDAKAFWQAAPSQEIAPTQIQNPRHHRSRSQSSIASRSTHDSARSSHSRQESTIENNSETATMLGAGFSEPRQSSASSTSYKAGPRHRHSRSIEEPHTTSAANNLSLAANPERLAQPNPFLPSNDDIQSSRYTLSLANVAAISHSDGTGIPDDPEGSNPANLLGDSTLPPRKSTPIRQEPTEVEQTVDNDEQESPDEHIVRHRPLTQEQILRAAIEMDDAASNTNSVQKPFSRPSTAKSAHRSRASTPLVVSHERVLDRPVFPSVAAEARPPSPKMRARASASVTTPDGSGRPPLQNHNINANPGNTRTTLGDNNTPGDNTDFLRIERPPSGANIAEEALEELRDDSHADEQRQDGNHHADEQRQDEIGISDLQQKSDASFADRLDHLAPAEHNTVPSEAQFGQLGTLGFNTQVEAEASEQPTPRTELDRDADEACAASTKNGDPPKPPKPPQRQKTLVRMLSNPENRVESARRRGPQRQWSFSVAQNVTHGLEKELVDDAARDEESTAEAKAPDAMDPADDHNTILSRIESEKSMTDSEYLQAAGVLSRTPSEHSLASQGSTRSLFTVNAGPNFLEDEDFDLDDELVRRRLSEASFQAREPVDDFSDDEDEYRLPSQLPPRKPGEQPMWQKLKLRPDPLLSGSSFTDLEAVQRRIYGLDESEPGETVSFREENNTDADGDVSLGDDEDDVQRFVADELRRAHSLSDANRQEPQTLYFHKGQLQVSIPKKEFSLHQEASNPRELHTPLNSIPGIGRAFGLRERVVPSSAPLAFSGPLELSRGTSPFARSQTSQTLQRDDDIPTDAITSEARAAAIKSAGPDLSFQASKLGHGGEQPASAGLAHNYVKRRSAKVSCDFSFVCVRCMCCRAACA